jgi:hypothetical protein
MTDANDLLDVIDQLTQPIRRKVMQELQNLADGKPHTTLTPVELPPLLTQLDEAIRGTIGIGGSGSLAHQRNMLDADALYKFTMITTMINDWAHVAKATIDMRDPAGTLRRWYIEYSKSPRSHESEQFHLKKMRSWVHVIETKLDPPNMRDLPDACPSCGASTWFNPSDRLEYLRPLVVEYKPTGADLIQQARCYCRACEKVWGVRELAYLLENDDEGLSA